MRLLLAGPRLMVQVLWGCWLGFGLLLFEGFGGEVVG